MKMKSLLLILLGSLWSYHLEALQLCLSSQLNPQNQQEIKAEKNYSGLIGGQAYTLSFDVNSINSSVVVLVDDGNSLQSINMVQTGNYTFNLQPVGTNALLIVQSISSKKQPSSICLDNLQLASESQQVAAMVYKEPVNNYRYAFQGQEKDDEFKMGIGNNYAYTYRMHDPRIGRFLSIDPLAQKFPFYSTYAFSGNRVIDAFELEGMEPVKGDPNFGRNLAFVSRDLINSVAPEQRDESNENWLGFVPNTLGDVYKTMKAVKKESKLRPQNVVLQFHGISIAGEENKRAISLDQGSDYSFTMTRTGNTQIATEEIQTYFKYKSDKSQGLPVDDNWYSQAGKYIGQLESIMGRIEKGGSLVFLGCDLGADEDFIRALYKLSGNRISIYASKDIVNNGSGSEIVLLGISFKNLPDDEGWVRIGPDTNGEVVPVGGEENQIKLSRTGDAIQVE